MRLLRVGNTFKVLTKKSGTLEGSEGTLGRSGGTLGGIEGMPE